MAICRCAWGQLDTRWSGPINGMFFQRQMASQRKRFGIFLIWGKPVNRIGLRPAQCLVFQETIPAEFITAILIKLIFVSARLLGYEAGIRFIDFYLEGKVSTPMGSCKFFFLKNRSRIIFAGGNGILVQLNHFLCSLSTACTIRRKTSLAVFFGCLQFFTQDQ